jgi:hypothetical protein
MFSVVRISLVCIVSAFSRTNLYPIIYLLRIAGGIRHLLLLLIGEILDIHHAEALTVSSLMSAINTSCIDIRRHLS